MNKNNFKNGDLFKDTSNSKNIIVTRDGVRVGLSVEEILKIERAKGDLDEILKNVDDGIQKKI